ncbi:MAG TPA: rod shape-determining protein [Candidatus Paceibacterota bacterium]|nr:rod shape-determining protein [Candidatus Paceibacterota bacterium]
MALFDRLFRDVGIDLGTANTLIYLKNRGLVINEPSVAAVNNKTNQILAVGDDAKKMLGRTPAHITVTRPLVNGVISDFEMTREMLYQFLKRLTNASLPFASFRRGILAIPNNLTEVERKSVEDAAKSAGCAKVYLVEEPVAAALGAGLPIDQPSGTLVIDIGGGTTDIAVISMGGTVVARTLKVAGDRFNNDVIQFVRDEFKLVIGEPTAEAAKIAVGSAIALDERLEVPIRGRDLSTGLPREVLVKNSHIRLALAKSLRVVVDSILEVIEATPPELVGDMLKQGLTLCGGGALLRGVDQMIQKETQVETRIAQEPLTCVVRGLGHIVDEFDLHRSLLDNPLRPMEIEL